MVSVLIVPDGGAEPRREGVPTSLERARTPAIDELCRDGRVLRAATTPPGLPPGSEAGIPTLLGCPPDAPLDRGAIEAAAVGAPLARGERAWRCDVEDEQGRRAGMTAATAARRDLRRRLPDHRVRALRGHRLLILGRDRPDVAPLRLWPEGALPAAGLDAETVVVAAEGAAAGCARLLGATVVVPAGATGGVDTDLVAKAAAALALLDRGTTRLMVHVGAPDEAAHARDAAAKAAAIERIDAEVVAPLSRAVRALGGWITVCPDHGCDPATGHHDGDPVPAVVCGAGVAAHGPDRLTERAVGDLPPSAPPAWRALAA